MQPQRAPDGARPTTSDTAPGRRRCTPPGTAARGQPWFIAYTQPNAGSVRGGCQTAAHLVDRGIPHVPVHQWVLALPIQLRVLLAAQPKLVTPVLQMCSA